MQNAFAISKFLWNARPNYRPIATGTARGVRSHPPDRSEFRIPEDFDFEPFLERQQLLDKASPWVAGLMLVGAFMLHEAWLLFAAFAAYFAFPQIVTIANGDAIMRPRVKGFLTARRDWDYYNKTTGEGFWQSLRGTELEDAVARLFRERGWQVETTRLTGDGGIDLILRRGEREVNVQCKGYAKPVSVAAVREIAGVCSASRAEPMLVVVNGVTRPARREAEAFSVTICDSHHLARFARSCDIDF